MKKFLIFILCLAFCLPLATSHAENKMNHKVSKSEKLRIIALSPHLTEIVFALGKGDSLIAVSDYSDFPEQAQNLPSIASYQGANIAEILRMKPTHVLVWRGGNKDADIQRLKALNVNVHESSIVRVSDLLVDIEAIGNFINAKETAKQLVSKLVKQKTQIEASYKDQQITALYYVNYQPLVGLGNDNWLNSLLSLCNIDNIYADSPSAYPQLKLGDILRQQPKIILAGMKQNNEQLNQYWSPHLPTLNSKIIAVNPDALHRFTPRAIIEMQRVCELVYSE